MSSLLLQISRMLAAKASLAIRVDALGEDTGSEMGIEHRAKLEARLRQMEDGQVGVVCDMWVWSVTCGCGL